MVPPAAGNPVAVLKHIGEVFGESRSPSTLLQDLFATSQFQGEAIRKYSYRVHGAFEAIIKPQRTLNVALTPAAILRDHFVSELRALTLRSYIREQLHRQPNLDFRGIRDVAIRWDNESSQPSSAPVNSASAAPLHTPKLKSPAAVSEDRIANIEKKLEELTLLLAQQKSNTRDTGIVRGQRVCYRCRRPGHLVKNCHLPAPGNGQPRQ